MFVLNLMVVYVSTGHTGLVWCCLGCAFVGCGAWAGHFEQHAATRGPLHAVAIEVNESLVHCTLCDRALSPAEQPVGSASSYYAIGFVTNLLAPSFGSIFFCLLLSFFFVISNTNLSCVYCLLLVVFC